MKTIVIIGGGGFLGSYITNTALCRGYGVVVIGRRPLNSISLERQQLITGAEYLSLDLADDTQLRETLSEISVSRQIVGVMMLAWSGVDRLSDTNADAQFSNIGKCCNALNICIELGWPKFIFAGSMEEAFARKYTNLDFRKDDKQNRHVIYALAKFYCRMSLKSVAEQRGYTGLSCLTNSHVMGLYDDKDSFLQVLIQTLLKGEEMNVSTGEQTFDVIHVKDCANAYMSVLESRFYGRDYWIGSGAPRELRAYMQLVEDRTEGRGKINYGKFPFRDVKLDPNDFNTNELLTDCDFKPQMSFIQMVDEMAGYYKERKAK